MDSERTEQQSTEDHRRSQQLSLKRTHPPVSVPGYELKEFLGSGAYGEVWVGVDQNTGRRVAVKFYTHRGGVDWSLLSREVEKLVFLSADRYVVQLLDVGWDSEPPYYVMDYIENGSLNDRLEQDGPMPVGQATELFREVAMGLVHAHGKGVLHCDLKPANVLLDEDAKPRLADFGQSRLSHEQSPSLGTLFYMAPEQADLAAVPDARWDVYALGALAYCAMTGAPPHRSEQALRRIDQADSLAERLRAYREAIRQSPSPAAHRRLRGMDRHLADIIQRCLAADPDQRYANAQEVLDALRLRERRRVRLPQVVLGFVGPLLLLAIMALFAVRGYTRAMDASEQEITRSARQSNYFAAKAIAGKAAENVQRYFQAVESVSRDKNFQEELQRVVEETQPLLAQLSDPTLNSRPLAARDQFTNHPARSELQRRIDELLRDSAMPQAASWFVCDAQGTQLASAFDVEDATSTVGQNFSWRTYFYGGPDDLRELSTVNGERRVTYRRPPDRQHISSTNLSAPFQSNATNKWKLAISTPIFRGHDRDDPDDFLGVVALTVDLGIFSRFDEGSESFFAVLVDGRAGRQQGMILQHPLFENKARLPDRFSNYRVPPQDEKSQLYRDPLGSDPEGADYDRLWIVAQASVMLESGRTSEGDANLLDTGLRVLVQEDYSRAIEPVHRLGRRLTREGLWALLVVLLVIVALWAFVLRILVEPVGGPPGAATPRTHSTPLYELSTLPARRRQD